MDLNAVSQILKGLLIRNGKVSLPETGTFVMKDVPAEFIGGGASIAPPSKEILFDNFEIADDGILENEYAKSKGITLENSRQEISEYVSFFKSEMTNNKRFVIKGFGALSLSKDYSFVFEPDSALVLSPDSFGLDTVKIDSGKNEEKSVGEAINENAQDNAVAASAVADNAVADNADAVSAVADNEVADSKAVDNAGADNETADNETADNEAADNEAAVVAEVVNKDNAAIAEAVSEDSAVASSVSEDDGAVASSVNKNDLAIPDVSVKSSVADVYRISPALMPPEVGKRSETMKGTIIVDSDNEESVKKTGAEAGNGKEKRRTRIADVLFFTKSNKKDGAEKKDGDEKKDSGEKRRTSFIPSAGVLGGHSYVFGQPIHSQATEVVVINEKGKYEIKLKDSAGAAKGIKGKTSLSGDNHGDTESNGPIQSAVGAIDVSQRTDNVNDVEVGVITGAAQNSQIEEGNNLSAEEIERREMHEKEAIEASELAAEKLIKNAHQKKIDDQHKIEEALAEAERIEAEKKAAKLEYEKNMEAANGRPIVDTEGQDETAKESIADIFTKAAEKESKMPVAQIVGEKESGKDWSAAENPATEAAGFSGEINPVPESEAPESIEHNGAEQPDAEPAAEEKSAKEKREKEQVEQEQVDTEAVHAAAKAETKNVTKKVSKRAAEKAARRNEKKKREEKLEQEKKNKIEQKKQALLDKKNKIEQEKQKAEQEKKNKIEQKKQALLDKKNKIEQEKQKAEQEKKQKEEAKFKKEREERQKIEDQKAQKLAAKQKVEQEKKDKIEQKKQAVLDKKNKIEQKKQALLDKKNKIEQEKQKAEEEKKQKEEAQFKKEREERQKIEDQKAQKLAAKQKTVQEKISSESKKEESVQKQKAQATHTHKAFITVAYIIAILVIIALLIYVFREPLRPLLEKLMYSQDELNIINYKL